MPWSRSFGHRKRRPRGPALAAKTATRTRHWSAPPRLQLLSNAYGCPRSKGWKTGELLAVFRRGGRARGRRLWHALGIHLPSRKAQFCSFRGVCGPCSSSIPQFPFPSPAPQQVRFSRILPIFSRIRRSGRIC
jgi:hypothetical protein